MKFCKHDIRRNMSWIITLLISVLFTPWVITKNYKFWDTEHIIHDYVKHLYYSNIRVSSTLELTMNEKKIIIDVYGIPILVMYFYRHAFIELANIASVMWSTSIGYLNIVHAHFDISI